jgi:hypothetical protein
MLLRRVIDDDENKQIIFQKLHDNDEHREKKNIYRRIANRY